MGETKGIQSSLNLCLVIFVINTSKCMYYCLSGIITKTVTVSDS